MKSTRDWSLYLIPGLVIGFILFCLGISISLNVEMDFLPDTYSSLYEVGREMVQSDRMPDTFPAGVWLDHAHSTQRIFCLRAWDGTWQKWVWTGAGTSPIDSGVGWLWWCGGILQMLLALLLGFGIACLIPQKFLERTLYA